MSTNEHGTQDWLNTMSDSCSLTSEKFSVDWSADRIGFGQFYFYINKEDGKLHCNNEMMSKNFIKRMLYKMVDDCILDDK